SELVAGNTAFAFDFYQTLREEDGNIVYSPYSISLAFAMAYAGARGETASQMADVLHYTLPEAQFHPAFNALDLDLAARPEQAANVDKNDRFELTIANALWGQKDWPFLPEYLDLLALNYGAGMRLVDFAKSPESARRAINDWVSDQTRKRIQNMLPPGMPDTSTRLVLANAIYFKAVWEYEFDANNTNDRPFTLLNGEIVNVPMMSQDHQKPFPYAAGEGWQAITLPYKGGLTEMVVIVPDLGNFEAVENILTAETYGQIVNQMQTEQVRLSMPKFKFETSLTLSNVLPQMGMTDAFNPDLADFSGMDGQRSLYISEALHKAFIAVDEKGTEAAAVTSVGMALTAMPRPEERFSLVVDRPFLIAILDRDTEAVLFLGAVRNPE
ncbi:MAG: serpin family protein, partial [candidate division WOR-3 bacterium]